MRCISRCVLFALFLCTASSQVFGWGCSGHQIVALIAERQLTANARQAVMDLLSGTPIDPTLKRFCGETTLGPMADAATWADDYREKDPASGNWHFWDIPLNEKEEPGSMEFCDQGCVNHAIKTHLRVLESSTAKREDKIKALMFVIHFMGDMHQPLHNINNNDRGGNCIPASFFELKPKGDDKGNYSPNLHSIWDTSILERSAGIRRESRDADVKRFADQLLRRYATQIAKWKTEPLEIDRWAWETHELAVSIGYGKLPAAVTPEEPVTMSTCLDDNNIGQRMLDLHEHIDQPYVTAAAPVIDRQLAKAGARLADVLNHAFTPHTSNSAQNQISPGLEYALKFADLKPGAVITVTGMNFTGQTSPSVASLQSQGVQSITFGGSFKYEWVPESLYSSMTLTMQDPLPGNAPSAAFSFSAYTIVFQAPGYLAFTPVGAATATATIPQIPRFKPVTTTGGQVSLELGPLPGCYIGGCGPVLDCQSDVCTCESDKKRETYNCCP